MYKLSYDFHIHSCLSPCADNDMTPYNIASFAQLLELDVLALTDHNSCKNCPAIIEVAERLSLLVIPGMELTTSEEIHVLCLFEELKAAVEFSDAEVYKDISRFNNDTTAFGEQLIMDSADKILGEERSFLLGATDISIDNLYTIVNGYGGVIVPAHIDRAHFSLLASLGYVPDYCGFNTVEIKYKEAVGNLTEKHEYLKSCKIIHDSDAHSLCNMSLPENFIEVKEKSVKAVLNALR